MPESANVFVYGTLLFPDVTSMLGLVSVDPQMGSDVPLIRRPATLANFTRHTVALRDVGNFPAIIAGGDGVEGHVLTNVSTASLQQMDEFEGIAEGYYSRDEVTVVANGAEVSAFAYVCGERLRGYLKGDWDPQRFEKNELAWYVKNVMGN